MKNGTAYGFCGILASIEESLLSEDLEEGRSEASEVGITYDVTEELAVELAA
jgi:hypothetical protein